MKSLVSIIIPTYNRSNLIGQTLESVLGQTYKHWECFVIDDGSTDDTQNTVEIYSKRDNRIKYLKRPNERPKGASSCRNYGLEQAKGNFIQFLDSDDIISRNKLECQIKLLEKDPHNSIATCKWGTFTDNPANSHIHQSLKAYDNFNDPLDFLEAMGVSICYFPPHAYLIRKSIITKAGYWNEYLTLNDDGEFMTRVIINSHNICFAEEGLAYYRLPSGDNLSLFDDKKKVSSAIQSWKLIESYLQIRFQREEFIFLKRAKNDFYMHSKVFPELIKENEFFFRDQLKRDSHWIKKIFN